MQLGEVDHESGHQRLTGALGGLTQLGGELQGEIGVLLPDLDGGLQPQHVVDGALGQTDRAGDGGADDILPLRGVSAVALHFKAHDAAALGMKGHGGHDQAWMAPICTLV